MLNEVARYLKREESDDDERDNVEKLFRLDPYVKFSLPFSMMMLIVSALWLCFLVAVRGYA